MKDLQTLIDESGMNRRQISLATGVNYSTLTAYLNKHGAAVKSVNRGELRSPDPVLQRGRLYQRKLSTNRSVGKTIVNP